MEPRSASPCRAVLVKLRWTQKFPGRLVYPADSLPPLPPCYPRSIYLRTSLSNKTSQGYWSKRPADHTSKTSCLDLFVGPRERVCKEKKNENVASGENLCGNWAMHHCKPCELWQEGVVCLEKESVLLQWGTLGGLLGVNPPLPTGSSREPKRQQMWQKSGHVAGKEEKRWSVPHVVGRACFTET